MDLVERTARLLEQEDLDLVELSNGVLSTQGVFS